MATRPKHGVTIFVQDVEKNLEYFTNTLGFTEVERQQMPDGSTMHGLVAFGTGASAISVGMAPIGGMSDMEYDFGEFGRSIRDSPSTLGNGVFFYFTVPNVDKYYAKINSNGAIIDEPPTNQFWGDRTISVRTPDGYYLTFATPIKGFKYPPESGVTVIKGGKTTKGRRTTTRRTTRSKKR
ncbi:MAG TPA: VOC family protein [Candidatus Thermoplasmatota archaeon]|nr:VOC family protein [Candidatus Thermoplasmatota archaeon]